CSTAISHLSLHDALPIFHETNVSPQMDSTVPEEAPELGSAPQHTIVRPMRTMPEPEPADEDASPDDQQLTWFTKKNILLGIAGRSEEHTSELQSRFDLVC